MTTKKPAITVAVTGCSGNIGYALLPRLVSGEVFGADTPVHLRLFDIHPSIPALKGVVMELEDCAFPNLQSVMISDQITEVMKGANWVILVGSVPRKQGMERSDLLKINGTIFKEQGRAINDYAAADVRVLVVGNPCNTNAMIAMHHAPDVPNDRFYAMTRLDENRAKAQLAAMAGVHVTDVNHMAIWGNHSATQYPDFFHATIKGKPATEVITDHNWLETTFLTTVQQRGAAIIQARGLSSAASAANAALSTVADLVRDTPAERGCYSVARVASGAYGIEDDLIVSFPCITQQGVCQIVTDWQQPEKGRQWLEVSLAELRAERDAVRALNLI